MGRFSKQYEIIAQEKQRNKVFSKGGSIDITGAKGSGSHNVQSNVN